MAASLSFANSLFLRFLGADATQEQRRALAFEIADKKSADPNYTTFQAIGDFVNDAYDLKHGAAIPQYVIDYYQHFTTTPSIAELTNWATQESVKSSAEIADLLSYLVYDVYARILDSQTDSLTLQAPASSSFAENSQLSDFTVQLVDSQNPDSQLPVVYSLDPNQVDNEAFEIDPATGVITFKELPDFEAKSSYQLLVFASQAETLIDVHKEITINIEDVAEPVDNTVTSLAISADTGKASDDFITQQNTQNISGVLQQPILANEIVEISLDGGNSFQIAPTETGDQSWSLDNQTLLDGAQQIVARVSNVFAMSGQALSQNYVLDVQQPTLQSATTATADSIGLNFTETVDTINVDGFQVTIGGQNRTVSGFSLADTALTLQLDNPILSRESISVSYTAPANVDNQLKDIAGNPLAGIVDQTVENQLPSEPIVLTLTTAGGESAVTVTEGDKIDYQIVLTSGSILAGETLQFTLQANNGSAVNPADFSDFIGINSNQFNFNQTLNANLIANDVVFSFSIQTENDNLVEGNESFDVQLLSPGVTPLSAEDLDVSVSGSPLVATIEDNDQQVLEANADNFSTLQNQAITDNVGSNDSLGDEPAEFTEVSAPLNGVWQLNNDGSFTYTPSPGFSGEDSFEYRITDVDGDFSTAVVTIDVLPNLPLAADDAFTTKDSQILTESVAGNDSEGDAPAVFANTSDPSHGALTFNSDGGFIYTPSGDFFGVDTFDYQITDSDGETSSATVSIDVLANVLPSAINDSFATKDNKELSESVAVNDEPGDAPSVYNAVSNPGNGSLAFNDDGSFIYTPSGEFIGVDSFDYQVTDADGESSTATVSIDVAANTAPTAVNDSFTTKDNKDLTDTVAGNDNPGDAPSVFSKTTDPANGSVVFNDDGSFTYAPSGEFIGTDSFDYQVTDEDGESSAATVSIDVIANTVPAAVNDSFTTKDNKDLTDTVAGNDNPGDAPSVYSKTTDPGNGSVVFNDDGSFTYTPSGSFVGADSFDYQVTDEDGESAAATVSIDVVANTLPSAANDSFTTKDNKDLSDSVASNDNPGDAPSVYSKTTDPANGSVVFNDDGSFTYTPSGEFIGVDSFDYQVTDEDGESSAATVSIDVVANTLPSAVNDSYTTKDNKDLSDSVASNDNPGDAPSVYSKTTDPANGSVVFNDDGSFTYTPSGSFIGTDSFDYQVTDEDGESSAATVSIDVVANTLPGAVNDSFTTKDNKDLSGNVASNDNPGDAPSVYSKTTDPANGSVVFNDDGSFTYTPSGTFIGTDSFDYQVTDEDGESSAATVSIDVVANTLPSAVNDSYTTKDNKDLSDSVASNDNPGDAPSTFSLVTAPGNGNITFNNDGSFTYSPSGSFAGTVSFDYQVTDEDGESSTATVSIDVVANQLPSAVNDSFTTKDNKDLTDSVASNDNPGDAPSVYSKTTDPANGGVVFNNDGSFTYTPSGSFIGTDSFDYQVTDEDGESSAATVSIDVVANQVPSAANDSFSVRQTKTLSGSVASNDSLGDTPSVFSKTSDPANGTVSFNDDGSFSYTSSGSFVGTVSFDYQVTDEDGESAVATASINVMTNNAPTAVNYHFSSATDQAINNSVASAITNLGDTPTTYANSNTPSNGSLTFNSDGSFSYTPNTGFNGSDSFNYQITDTDGDVDSGTVNISVNANSFNFTTEIDALTGSGSDDVFTADNTTVQVTSVQDSADAGAGSNDELRMLVDSASDIVFPGTLLNFEIFSIDGSNLNLFDDVDISTQSFNTLALSSFDLEGGGNRDVTLGTVQNLSLSGMKETNANGGDTLRVAQDAGVSSINLTLDGLGDFVTDSFANNLPEVELTGSGLNTLNIASVNNKNALRLHHTGSSLNTINISGDQFLIIDSDSTISAGSGPLNINAGSNSGGIDLKAVFFNHDLTITGSSNSDKMFIKDTDVVDGVTGFDVVKFFDAVSASNLDDSDLLNIDWISIENPASESYDFSNQTEDIIIDSFNNGTADTISGSLGFDKFIADDTDSLDGVAGGDLAVFQGSVSATNLSNADLINISDVEVFSFVASLETFDFSPQTESLFFIIVDDTFQSGSKGAEVIGGSGVNFIESGLNEDTLTGNSSQDFFLLTFHHATSDFGADSITNFDVPDDNDQVEADANGTNVLNVTNASNIKSVFDSLPGSNETFIADAGLVIIDNAANFDTTDSASLSTADVAAYVNNFSITPTDKLVFENNNSLFYLVVSDGTDTGIFQADAAAGNGDTTIDAAELKLIATLEFIDDAGSLSGSFTGLF